ncbi:hypothetical protein Tco_0939614 [Tanacetum coccineum]|uniref:Uncharacterized protein n=1 Tax=Tanacetum coccineum TaxID=301880 RepID=A0ABQ5DRP0_9ASTR
MWIFMMKVDLDGLSRMALKLRVTIKLPFPLRIWSEREGGEVPLGVRGSIIDDQDRSIAIFTVICAFHAPRSTDVSFLQRITPEPCAAEDAQARQPSKEQASALWFIIRLHADWIMAQAGRASWFLASAREDELDELLPAFHPAGSSPLLSLVDLLCIPTFSLRGVVFDVPIPTVPTFSTMDSAGSHRRVDDEMSNCMSRVAADPDSDDEVLGLRFSFGVSLSLVMVLYLWTNSLMMRLLDPRSESESDDDIEDYIPPIPYGAFKRMGRLMCVAAIVTLNLSILSGKSAGTRTFSTRKSANHMS